jgi:hypothetical protein
MTRNKSEHSLGRYRKLTYVMNIVRFGTHNGYRDFYLPGYNAEYSDFLLALVTNPEDGEDIFLRKVG